MASSDEDEAKDKRSQDPKTSLRVEGEDSKAAANAAKEEEPEVK